MPTNGNKRIGESLIGLSGLLIVAISTFSAGTMGFDTAPLNGFSASKWSTSHRLTTSYYLKKLPLAGTSPISVICLSDGKLLVVSPIEFFSDQSALTTLRWAIPSRAIARGGATSQRIIASPIRHFDAVIDKDFKANLARKRYHRICDRKVPRDLNPCAEARWHYRQAKACLAAREKWEIKWGTAETTEPHGRALENVRARVKNAGKAQLRFCSLRDQN
ncbi:hypothetical protein ACJJH9_10695 [Microbulbifer sp. DLAB2-AF]|uniref:hypothetical protein n=1 Tax=Microbulbifer sp. DLAB2-AF TaxID=3243395 RepID=UPI0040393B39